jgi:exonuclease VII large subunit
MADVLQLAQEIEQTFTQEREAIDNLKKGLDLRVAKVKKRERDIDEREKQLAEWERALNAKYEEVSRIENAKELEEKARIKNADTELTFKNVVAERQKAEQSLIEVQARQDEVLKRELAVSEREKTYREKIRREFADSLVSKFRQ